MKINGTMNIKDILVKYPETIEIFRNNGFKGVEKAEVLEKLSTITLEEAMRLKKMDLNSFIALLTESINSKMKNSEISKSNGELSLMGLLPCPVRIPLLKKFEEFLNNNPDLNLSYQLKAASAGLGWIKENVIKTDKIENLADIFISAGFDLFFEKDLMGKFKERKVFKDISGVENYNSALQSLKDPYGEYSIIGAVPAIFMVNKNLLGDRISPKSWADILKPEFKASISLPVADFDLFNAILVNIYKLYGENGVKALGRNLMSNMHPAEMVGSNGPTITVMPFFFSKMIRENSPMMPIWPEDGAIISPIFMLTKADKADKLKKIAEFMSGKEIGEILSHQGLFPSTNPEVSNISDEKPMMWIGWDHIYSIDMGKTIKHCEKLFKEGVDNQ